MLSRLLLRMKSSSTANAASTSISVATSSAKISDNPVSPDTNKEPKPPTKVKNNELLNNLIKLKNQFKRKELLARISSAKAENEYYENLHRHLDDIVLDDTPRKRYSITQLPKNKLCEHGRQQNKCKECGGADICEHGREKYYCKECGGKGICIHGKRRSRCKECEG